jgi:hypothetical protein
LSTKALGPAGIIILITGAGGVLKQILVDSGIGKIMAESMADSALPPILLAWLLAAVVRVTQGSATVAMITAAGIIAPVLSEFGLNDPQRALVVLAIASGANTAFTCKRQRLLARGKILWNDGKTNPAVVDGDGIDYCGLRSGVYFAGKPLFLRAKDKYSKANKTQNLKIQDSKRFCRIWILLVEIYLRFVSCFLEFLISQMMYFEFKKFSDLSLNELVRHSPASFRNFCGRTKLCLQRFGWAG